MFAQLADYARNNQEEILDRTLEHLGLALGALSLAAVVGVGFGLLIARVRRLSRPVLAVAGVLQTIPSLALLGFLIPLVGIGPEPAVIALFLYALLPIVSNTYTGVVEVDPNARDAARGMGLTPRQILLQLELPLAAPVIFAGLRTAGVITVGIATLAGLVGGGGLGVFIFRGISLNDSAMILAGGVPTAVLALLLDGGLGLLQKGGRKAQWGVGAAYAALLLAAGVLLLWPQEDRLVAGFEPEFTERPDGYRGLARTYGLDFELRELQSGLMYKAVVTGQVDVISGYATDGRIAAYNLRLLQDDRQYFPPYDCAPLVRRETLRKHPEVGALLGELHNKLTDSLMRHLNYLVDHDRLEAREAARRGLQSLGYQTNIRRSGPPDLIIGGKVFTEQYVLAELFKLLLENYSPLTVGLEVGLGGTQIAFEALRQGSIDLYPEYTGTGLRVLLDAPPAVTDSLGSSRPAVYRYVRQQFRRQYDLLWLPPLGFNNTYVLMMREDRAEELGATTISDLAQSSPGNP